MDANKLISQRKRSSLKQKHLFPENMSYEEFMNTQKQKKLQWDSKVAPDENETQNHSDNKARFKESDTQFKDVDSTDDVYLHKLHEINKIKPTKEVIDEIIEIVEEENSREEEDMNRNNIKIDEEIPKKAENFEDNRRKSIKDEFSVAKDLLKMKINEDDELEPEVIEKTMKNTLYNKCVGKLEDEDSD